MINETAKQLGEYIKKLRKDKKVTAKELGSYVGYSQSYISALENNNNNNVPSKKVLDRLATAFWHIGYSSKEVEKKLYEIAGYPPKFDFLDKNDSLIMDMSKYVGSYDNISNQVLEKPYLSLSYLLENDFDLKFNYRNNGQDHMVTLENKHKVFIKNMISQMLLVDNIKEKIEKEMEEILLENQKFTNENYPYRKLEEKIEKLQLDLRILHDIKRNFSEENFEYKYNNAIQVFTMTLEENEKELDFSKENLLKAIDYVTKEITNLTVIYDHLDKDKED